MLGFLVGALAAEEGNADTWAINPKMTAVNVVSFIVLFPALPQLGAQSVDFFVRDEVSAIFSLSDPPQ